MKIAELIGRGLCPMKTTLRYEGGMTRNSDFLTKTVIFKRIFTEEIKSLKDLKLIDYDYLDDVFPSMLFKTRKEKAKYIDNCLEKFEKVTYRMRGVLDKTLLQKIEDTVEFNGRSFEVKADIALEDEKTIELFYIKNSNAQYKVNGRTDNTKAEKSLELFFLLLLGKKIRPNKIVKASYIHLKEDIDSKNFLVSMYPVEERISEFAEKVDSLLLVQKYEKACSSSSCMFCEYKSLCEYKHNLELLPEEDDISVEEAPDKSKLPTISFTNEQQRVIDFVKGIGVINAVPGAGKTATMAKRLESLIEIHKVNPKDILVLSFSSRSVDEFKQKLKKNHGIVEFENVFTFNGFGDENIARNYGYFGYTSKPRLFKNVIEKLDIIKEIIDNSEEITEIQQIADEYNTRQCLVHSLNYANPFQKSGNSKTGVVFKIEQIFNYIKSKGVNYGKLEFILDEVFGFENEVMKDTRLEEEKQKHLINLYEDFLDKVYDMYAAYDRLLKKRGLYDYLDQVNYLAYSLNHPRITSFNYKHIICDEFQDSNSLAMYVLKRLTYADDFESLVVVGDINQSIYGFMGTTPQNLMTFKDRFEEVHVEELGLSQTFRVPGLIAKKANSLMLDSYEIKYNQMRATREGHGAISTFADKKNMVEGIKEKITKGEDIGIIVRNNVDLNDFIDMMVENDIPYIIKSNLDILKKDKVKSLLHFADFIKNPSSNTLELAKYLQVAQNEEFKKYFKTSDFNTYIERALENFLILSSGKNPRELLKVYFTLLDEVAEKDYMVEVFVEHLKKQNFKSIYDASEYCEKLEVYGAELKAPENTKECSVTLMTAHSSKGREYDNIIMDTSTFTAKTEEDRRLFYVAMTRAKENLYLVKLGKQNSKKDCSRFLAAMGLVS